MFSTCLGAQQEDIQRSGYFAATSYVSNGAQVGTSTDPQSQCLVVWNLLTASVWWSAATPASCLAVDAKSGAFAVVLPREPVRRWVPNQAQAQLPQLQGEAIVDMKGI